MAETAASLPVLEERAPADEREGTRDERGRLLPGHAYRWPPGTSGNPSGKARQPVTEELRLLLEEEPRLARALATRLLEHFRAGRATAIREVLQRLEGRVPYTIQGAEENAESQVELLVRIVDEPIPPTAPPLLPK